VFTLPPPSVPGSPNCSSASVLRASLGHAESKNSTASTEARECRAGQICARAELPEAIPTAGATARPAPASLATTAGAGLSAPWTVGLGAVEAPANSLPRPGGRAVCRRPCRSRTKTCLGSFRLETPSQSTSATTPRLSCRTRQGSTSARSASASRRIRTDSADSDLFAYTRRAVSPCRRNPSSQGASNAAARASRLVESQISSSSCCISDVRSDTSIAVSRRASATTLRGRASTQRAVAARATLPRSPLSPAKRQMARRPSPSGVVREARSSISAA